MLLILPNFIIQPLAKCHHRHVIFLLGRIVPISLCTTTYVDFFLSPESMLLNYVTMITFPMCELFKSTVRPAGAANFHKLKHVRSTLKHTSNSCKCWNKISYIYKCWIETIDLNEEILIWPDWVTGVCLLYYTIDVHDWSVGWLGWEPVCWSIGLSNEKTNKWWPETDEIKHKLQNNDPFQMCCCLMYNTQL